MVTRELFREMTASLSDYGVENARFEAECLLGLLGFDRITLLIEPNAPVPDDIVAKARELLYRRTSGEPLQYILGEWEFYGFPFKVGEGVLIPRQDTETLVEAAQGFLEKRGSEEKNCADLCAGSGCIGVSLARLCGCHVKCYELSEKAFGFLRENIALNGVEQLVEPIFADVLSCGESGSFDLIVSNPPYLTREDMARLQPEVAKEPEMALFGGTDGLDFYRGILSRWMKRLKRGGMMAVEIGIGQESDVMQLFRENGLTADCIKDACGIFRVVLGIKE